MYSAFRAVYYIFKIRRSLKRLNNRYGSAYQGDSLFITREVD